MAALANPLTHRLAWVFLRAALRAAMRNVELRVEGLEHFPTTGPAIIAARHFHHFYDGAALLTLAPRPMRVVVTLDWVENPLGWRAMRAACRAAGWPVVPRPSPLSPSASRHPLRAAARQSADLLRAGRVLLVFPEGYPTIDPGYTPKTRDDEVLPFRSGFVRFAALAERDGRTRVPIVPAGLEYARGDRWKLTVRFGSPASVASGAGFDEQASEIERRVRQLSGLPFASTYPVWLPSRRRGGGAGPTIPGDDDHAEEHEVTETQTNPVELLEQADGAFRAVLANVSPEQMGLPTVNDEWDVRALINHVVLGSAWAAEVVRTGNAPRPSGDGIGDREPMEAYADSVGNMIAAFREPGALGRTVTMPFGEMPAAGLAMFRFGDLLSHAWDLAQATGQSTDIAPELCEAALAMSRQRLDGMDRANLPFKDEIHVPVEACAADRLAGYLGKPVGTG